MDVKPGRLAGNLVLLRRDGDRAEGRFDPVHGSLMPMRHPGDTHRNPPVRQWAWLDSPHGEHTWNLQ